MIKILHVTACRWNNNSVSFSPYGDAVLHHAELVASSTPGPRQVHVYMCVCLWIIMHQSTHVHIDTHMFIQHIHSHIHSLYFVLPIFIEVKKDGCSDRGAVST